MFLDCVLEEKIEPYMDTYREQERRSFFGGANIACGLLEDTLMN